MGSSPSDPTPSTFDRLQRGEPVLDDLVAEHLPQLRAFVRANMSPELRVRETTSDIVQTVCRALLEARTEFDYQGEAEFRGWLYTAARRKLFEKFRFHQAKKRDQRREVSPAADATLVAGYASVASPSEGVMAAERVAWVEGALDALSEEHREVIALSRLAQLPFAEVGARMNRSADAARKLLGRALVCLATELRDRRSGDG